MFSSAETKVVTASASGVARLWRIHHGALEWELYGHDDAYMRCATLSPDRRFMATASALPQLELVFKDHDDWVNTAVFPERCCVPVRIYMMHTPYVDVAVLVEDGEDPGRMASTFVESAGKRGELRTSQRRVIVSILERATASLPM